MAGSVRPMSVKISSDLEHDLCRFGEERGERGGTGRGGRRRAVISLVIRGCFQAEAAVGGLGMVVINFISL